jgi:hypothetical protein
MHFERGKRERGAVHQTIRVFELHDSGRMVRGRFGRFSGFRMNRMKRAARQKRKES